MGTFNDLTGQSFHRLTAIHRVSNSGHHTMWRSLCDCGRIVDVRAQHLRNGNTKSCGCLDAEKTAERNHKHGMCGTPTYRTWKAMWTRCTNPNTQDYHLYFARGISVCDEWRDFGVFLRDMGERPVGKTLDRIDNDKGYFKSNCRWATAKEQRANQRAMKSKL